MLEKQLCVCVLLIALPGLPDFSWSKHTKTEQLHKLYQQWSLKIPTTTFSIPKPTKFYQNWNSWFENKPSGNF
jgi:hypothetical protein